MEVLMRLRMLDFMAPPMSLTIGGRTGIKTLFGLIMTAGYFSALLSFTIIIGLNYLDTTDPIINQQTAEGGTYPKISLVENKMFPVIYIFKDLTKTMHVSEVPKYVTPIMTKSKISVALGANGTPQTTFERMPVSLIPCTELKKNETAYKYYNDYENTEFFSMFGKDFGYCLQVDEKEFYVQGGGTESKVDMLSLDIYPCSLTTGCAPFEDITRVAVVLSFPTFSTNYSNYEQPVIPFLTSDNIYVINPSSQGVYSSKLSMNEIYDNRGVLFKRTLRKSYSEVSKVVPSSRYRAFNQSNCSLESILKTQCPAYYTFDYMSTGKKVTIIRNYKGLTNFLAELGGINSICFVVFFYLNFAYVSYAKQNLLVENIFSFLGTGKNKIGDKKKNNSKDDATNSFLKKNAYGLIRDSLDILNIVRELNTLKVLTQFILSDRHKQATPAVALNLYLANMAEKGKPVVRGCLDPVLSEDTGDVRAAIRLIREKWAEHDQGDAINNNFDQKLDLFFKEEIDKNLLPNLVETEEVPNKHSELQLFKKDSWGQFESDKTIRGLPNKSAVILDPILQRSAEQSPFLKSSPNNVKPVSFKKR